MIIISAIALACLVFSSGIFILAFSTKNNLGILYKIGGWIILSAGGLLIFLCVFIGSFNAICHQNGRDCSDTKKECCRIKDYHRSKNHCNKDKSKKCNYSKKYSNCSVEERIDEGSKNDEGVQPNNDTIH